MFDDALANLLDLSAKTRRSKLGDLVPLIYDFMWTLQGPESDYRGSRLYALCPFKGVLDVLFPNDAVQDRPDKSTIRNETGTWVHKMFQNFILAKSKILWGDWRCVRCGYLRKSSYWPGPSTKKGLKGYSACLVEGPDVDEVFYNHKWEYEELEVAWEGMKPDGTDILGHIDGIWFPDEVKTIIDIKTTTAKTFNYYLNRPSEDHCYQVQVYMNLLPAEQADILYVNLETGEMKSFRIERNSQIMDDAEKKIEARKLWYETFNGDKKRFAKELLAENKRTRTMFDALPERACEDTDCKRAKFCPQARNCWNLPLIEGAIRRAAKGDE